MELEEAIKYLRMIIRTLDTQAPNINVRNVACLKKQAIETVLAELDRRIAPEVIEEKLKNTFDILDEKYSVDKISVFSGNTYMEKFKLLGKVELCKELLKKE